MKIYVASSWRNPYQSNLVMILQRMGHEVYDFRNPPNGKKGFAWSDIDVNWLDWKPDQYVLALRHSLAESGFKNDFDAMKWADCCLLVLPSGRSAHTEAGWMKGAGKKVYVFFTSNNEPELMYKVYDGIITSRAELDNIFGIKESTH